MNILKPKFNIQLLSISNTLKGVEILILRHRSVLFENKITPIYHVKDLCGIVLRTLICIRMAP